MKISTFLVSTLTCASLSAFPVALFTASSAQAQNNLVLFGAGKEATLGYVIRTTRPNDRLNSINFFAPLPKNKAVSELQVLYPEGFGSAIDPDNVEIVIRQTKQKVKVREVLVDREVRSVRFIFQEPIASKPNQELEIVATGVTNPSRSGMFRFEVQALGTEANPLFQFLGQWLVTIY
ncbi:DUF2808 domain-containing protein [Tumidithrix elongata RA019]|uniref:DUF2808 domain-containing protein n=1 Tax=Tumidithrix elongata BACA0141 TaxID=2716417 RepID=A0AAW9PRV9_9CYAN|nr:DUF2808 domain-containing protein [Tumidithrix elongata RA019]